MGAVVLGRSKLRQAGIINFEDISAALEEQKKKVEQNADEALPDASGGDDKANSSRQRPASKTIWNHSRSSKVLFMFISVVEPYEINVLNDVLNTKDSEAMAAKTGSDGSVDLRIYEKERKEESEGEKQSEQYADKIQKIAISGNIDKRKSVLLKAKAIAAELQKQMKSKSEPEQERTNGAPQGYNFLLKYQNAK